MDHFLYKFYCKHQLIFLQPLERVVNPFHKGLRLFAVLSVLCFLTACTPSHKFTALVSDPPVAVSDFTLTGSDDSIFHLSDLRGKYILLEFGYTSCPDVCPATLAQLRVAREKLGTLAEQTAVVFVSVDPERDTAERVRNYAHAFADDFVGVSGKVAEIDAACEIFGEQYSLDKSKSSAETNYEVNHSAYVYVIDPQFRLRLTIPFGAQAEEIASDLRALMQE